MSDRTEVVFEDGDLATARQLIDRIELRLQVDQKLRDLRGDDTDSIDVDSFDATGGKPAADVLREVDRLLDGGNRRAS